MSRQFAQLTPVKSIKIGLFWAAASSRACSKLMPQRTPCAFFSSLSAWAGSVEVALTDLEDRRPVPPPPANWVRALKFARIRRQDADDQPIPDQALRAAAQRGPEACKEPNPGRAAPKMIRPVPTLTSPWSWSVRKTPSR